MANGKRIKAYYALIAQWQREGTYTPKAILMALFKLYVNQPPIVILKKKFVFVSLFSFFDDKTIKPIRTQTTYIKKNLPLLADAVTHQDLLHFLLRLDNELSIARLKSYNFEDDLHILLIAFFIDYPHIFPAIQFKATPNPNIRVDESSNFQDKRPLSVLKNCWVAARLFQQKIAYKDLQFILAHTNNKGESLKPIIAYISSFQYFHKKEELLSTEDLFYYKIENEATSVAEDLQDNPNFYQKLCNYLLPGPYPPRTREIIMRFSLIKKFASQFKKDNINEIFSIMVEHFRFDFEDTLNNFTDWEDTYVHSLKSASHEVTEYVVKILRYLATLTDINELFETIMKNLDYFSGEHARKKYTHNTPDSNGGGIIHNIFMGRDFSFLKRHAFFKALDILIPLLNPNHFNTILKILHKYLRSDFIDAEEQNFITNLYPHFGRTKKHCAELNTLTTLFPFLEDHERQNWIPYLFSQLYSSLKLIETSTVLKALLSISSFSFSQEEDFMNILLNEVIYNYRSWECREFSLAMNLITTRFKHISDDELLNLFAIILGLKYSNLDHHFNLFGKENDLVKLLTVKKKQKERFISAFIQAYITFTIKNAQGDKLQSLFIILESDTLIILHNFALNELIKLYSNATPIQQARIFDYSIENLYGYSNIREALPSLIPKLTNIQISRIFQQQLDTKKEDNPNHCYLTYAFEVLRMLIPSLSNKERELLLSECQFTLNHINSNQFQVKLDILSHLIPLISTEACNDMQHSLIAYLIRLCDEPDKFTEERQLLIQVLKIMGVLLKPEQMAPNISILFKIINLDCNVISLIASWAAFIPSLRLRIISEFRALSNLENQNQYVKTECLIGIYRIREHTDTETLSYNYFSSLRVPKDVCDTLIKYSRI